MAYFSGCLIKTENKKGSTHIQPEKGLHERFQVECVGTTNFDLQEEEEKNLRVNFIAIKNCYLVLHKDG